MKLKALGATLLMVTTVGACRTESPKVVVLDGWWTPDFAQGTCDLAASWLKENRHLINQIGCENVPACREVMRLYTACTARDPKEQAREFEEVIKSEFAKSTSCGGIVFARHGRAATEPPNPWALALINKPHWTLIVDYEPGKATQDWTLVGASIEPQPSLVSGTGSAREIVRKVCTVVNGRGGKTLD